MPRYIDAEKIEYDDLSLVILELHNVTFKEDVDKIPTADVEEVKHGKWDGNGYLKHCSLCGMIVNFNEVANWLYNYCPSCGARMDKKESEENAEIH